MRIIPGDFTDTRVKALLEYHLRGMFANSPPGQVFALDWSSLQKPEIRFFVGWKETQPIVMGALKDLGAGCGEIKSMRVAEGQVGKGYGEAMLRHLIAQARRHCVEHLCLETGTGPGFEPAVKLYQKFGFERGHKFGDYAQSSFNQFMHLKLQLSVSV